jgi:hypothetical protein
MHDGLLIVVTLQLNHNQQATVAWLQTQLQYIAASGAAALDGLSGAVHC